MEISNCDLVIINFDLLDVRSAVRAKQASLDSELSLDSVMFCRSTGCRFPVDAARTGAVTL